MKRFLLMSALAALPAAVAVQGCSGTVQCNASNCTGCCDADNLCQPPAADHCGQGGNQCSVCPTLQQCVVGVCSFASGNNGTTTGTHTTATSSTTGAASTSTGTTGTTTGTTGTTSTTGTTTHSSSTGTTGTHSSSTSTTTTTSTTSTGTGTTGTGTTGTTSTTSTGTTGTTGTVPPCVPISVAAARTQPAGTDICLDRVSVLAQHTPGAASGTGTATSADYYVADSTAAIHVYKNKNWTATYDPSRGELVRVQSKIIPFPADGGSNAELELADPSEVITAQGSGTVPTPTQVALSSVDGLSGDYGLVGQYVSIAPGSYTQDNANAVFLFTSATGTTSYDGVVLSDGVSTVYVQLHRFSSSTSQSCNPQGSPPSIASTGMAGVFDITKLKDGNYYKVLYLGDCADLHP